MRISWMLWIVIGMVGCKNKEATPAAGSGSSAPPVAPSGSGSGSATGSGSEDAPMDAAPGSNAPSAASGGATIKFAAPTDGWTRTDDAEGGELEQEPAHGAIFTVKFKPIDTEGEPPPEPADYGDWYSLQFKTKVDRTEKLGDAVYYEFYGPRDATPEDKTWEVVKKIDGVLWTCGGSRYLEAGYNEIPDVRKTALAEAKQICASMH